MKIVDVRTELLQERDALRVEVERLRAYEAEWKKAVDDNERLRAESDDWQRRAIKAHTTFLLSQDELERLGEALEELYEAIQHVEHGDEDYPRLEAALAGARRALEGK